MVRSGSLEYSWKSCRLACRVQFRFIGELSRNVLGEQGTAPQVSRTGFAQNQLLHLGHGCLVIPSSLKKFSANSSGAISNISASSVVSSTNENSSGSS